MELAQRNNTSDFQHAHFVLVSSWEIISSLKFVFLVLHAEENELKSIFFVHFVC